MSDQPAGDPWKAHMWPCPLFYSGNWHKARPYPNVVCTCDAPRLPIDLEGIKARDARTGNYGNPTENADRRALIAEVEALRDILTRLAEQAAQDFNITEEEYETSGNPAVTVEHAAAKGDARAALILEARRAVTS